MNKKFLIFVEDPGAVNMILDLPKFFAKQNICFDIFANNYASKILSSHNIDHIILNNLEQFNFYLENNYCTFLIGTSENVISIGLDLIDIGKSKNIKTIGFVDMFTNAAYRFKGISDDPLKYQPDFLLVTDEITKKAFVEIGMNKNNIFVCNHPQIERIKQMKKKFENIFEKKEEQPRKWLFISENIDLFNPEESYKSEKYTLFGRGKTTWRTGIIIEEILEALKIISPESKLVVRLHPKNNLGQFDPWSDEIIFESIKDPLESVWNADFILGMSSNLLVEAIYLDKLVLSILPRLQEKEWMHELKTGIIPTVFTRRELREKMKNFYYKSNDLSVNNIKDKILTSHKNFSMEEIIISI